MYFSTDQQTWNDLKVFGKNGERSLFSLFDKTLTRGGAEQLENMFRYPLADENKIKDRQQILAYFTASEQKFPCDPGLLEVIEQYLANNDERSRLKEKEESSLVEKLKGFVAADPQVKTMESGLYALHELSIVISGFLNEKLKKSIETDSAFYKTELEPMQQWVNDEDLRSFLEEKSIRTATYNTLVGYDSLLRFKKRDAAYRLLKRVYMWDAYLSVTKVAKERNFCYAEVKPASAREFMLEGVYHPYLDNPVANNLMMDSSGNVLFLTGANMAGKSTLMKTIGMALYLAHMGFPIPAKAMSFSVKEGIFTSINLPDSLNKGISHFYAEVLRIKKVAMEVGLGKHLLVIVDELFRGTNVKDAYEATVAITEAFAKKTNCMFVVSTHIMEAGTILKEANLPIQFCYLPTEMEGMAPVYTYKLNAGITEDRHGMVIVENSGILDLLKIK
ncbi:MutS-related protein [Sphingobacterium faecale]|uniref:DNA mismatch repair protein n=1 Tax=Sphingobacterium faecale TaxID=2803775 RepID=A0ABS1R7C8_9SPHI|nr:DNA mismatch repair protein [Sphingobacterium faecale]MBL1410583.1 DNA mismatch repair protein [Sphingobacterium faecale]